MRLTVRHRFDFGPDRALVGDDLVRPEAWDALRTQTSGGFAMATTREELEAQADERPEIGERTRLISEWLDGQGAGTLASYGVGGAVVELWLTRHAPQRRIVATDYGEATLERLRRLLPEVEAVHHDLLADPPIAADVHLFHRIDTEFSNRQFREILRRFSDQTILVVATQVMTMEGLAIELRKALMRNTSRAGWARNADAFEALWKRTHDAEPMSFADLGGWVLRPRS